LGKIVEFKVTVCTLVAWVLWISSGLTFMAIGFGLVAIEWAGMALLPLSAGHVLYIRRAIREAHLNAACAFDLGRMTADPEVTPIRRGR
jgi:hypothetical protein